MLTLSGYVEFLFLLYICCPPWICVVVSVILVVYSLCVFLSMCLFVLCVLCLTVLVNCLLNAFAICVGGGVNVISEFNSEIRWITCVVCSDVIFIFYFMSYVF